MTYFLLRKVPLLGLFFILLTEHSYSISEKEWENLLYIDSGKFLIRDPNFYFGTSKKDAKLELELVRKILEDDKKSDLICKYPARFFWANNYFNLKKKIDYSRCKDLTTFLEKAPADSVKVVFASENISIPSSMMGHVYLKIDGVNHEKVTVSHALSYFTNLAGGNFPKLVYETIISGKEGYYALSPSYQLRDNYLKNEDRNVWQYEIKLNEFQRRLLHLHLYELKNIKLTYFFHKFNCATLIYRILNVAHPEMGKINRPWITPLDVVREIHKVNLISKQYVELSDSWKLKALIFSEALPSSKINNIKSSEFDFKNASFIERETKNTYLSYQLYNNDINRDEYDAQIKELSSIKEENFSYLDLTNYKNPVKTKSTAQVAFGADVFNGESFFNLNIMPASHKLEDDNSQYLNESELQISSLTIASSRKEAQIQEYILYSSLMLMPSDTLTGGLSSDLELGHIRETNQKLEKDSKLLVRGKVGKTYRLHYDLDSFLLMGTSLVDGLEFVPEIEAGAIIRGVYKMKFIFSLSDRYFSKHNYERVSLISSKLAMDLDNYMFVLKTENYFKGDESANEISLTLKRYF